MKATLIILILNISVTLMAQDPVTSKVYSWEKTNLSPTKKQFFSGSTTDLEQVDFYSMSIKTGESTVVNNAANTNLERLFIIKEGQVEFEIGEEKKTIGPGSVAMVMPGESYSIVNNESKDATFYIMEYRSKQSQNSLRGDSSGGSFIIDYEKLTFNPHGKGGIRNYFNRPTTMCQYFEMHVTTLNGGIKSHEPHTHRAAEIVLMINGNSEMQIGDEFYQGTTGDIYFLGSNVSHAIQNTGKEPCMYFAFQWR